VLLAERFLLCRTEPDKLESIEETDMTTVIAVVLGSGLQKDGKPSPVTTIRAHEAAQLASEVKLDKLILSGSQAADSIMAHSTTEAAEMAAIIRQDLGSNTPPLACEDKSLDTLGNAIFTARLFLATEKPGTLWIVTSPFHMERAIYLFERVLPGWKILARPCVEWEHETRQSGAAAAMQRAKEFFADLSDGDIEAAYTKLTTRPPYTASVAAAPAAPAPSAPSQ
jgi:vancomycin permeability regulator SanA